MTGDDLMRCSDPACTKVHPPRELGETAVRALLRAQRGQRHAAAGTLVYLAEKYGPAGLVFAARVWAQLAIERTALRDVDGDQFDGLVFGTLDEHGVVDPTVPQQSIDEVDPGWRWAGRFLLAVKLDDGDQLEALVGSVQDDTDQLVDATLHLLLACGAALANPERVLHEAADPT